MIRRCEDGDFAAIYYIVNKAAEKYRGVIPEDCWKVPYMSEQELGREIGEGIEFWGYQSKDGLMGVMGIQPVKDVALIRHAYVLPSEQGRGIGTELLSFLCKKTARPILIGTWRDAGWAVRFYEKRGFRRVPHQEKNQLLRKYWSVPGRQVETSVVLADEAWFEEQMGRRAVNKRGVVPTGTTTFYTMIGTPVIQVKSPLLYNRYFAEHGMDAVMIAMDVPADQVKEHFVLMRTVSNFGGCIVTVPHKQSAVEFMDEISERAENLLSVNVVRAENGRLIGDMVDGLGFMVAVKSHGLSVHGKRAAVIGGGCAGAAIAQAIAQSGADEIVIREIRTERHGFLERLLKETNPAIRVSFELAGLEGFDLVVNATPVGMNDDAHVPFPTESLCPPTLVADVVTNPGVTPWLAAALEKGCKVQYGAEMAYGQFGLMGRHLGLDIPDPQDLSEFISGSGWKSPRI
jgi:shikimate dehydrogenase